MISDFIARLYNWRRAYGDKSTLSVSITYVFCKYLEETTERLRETDEQRRHRENSELAYREPPLPPIDYEDADLLQDVWRAMPDFIENKPVKKFIKVFTFGTKRDYDNMRWRSRISPQDEANWRNKQIALFFDRVSTEQAIRKQLKL
ncbi:MAG: hypothetical protein KH037_10490 [Burkholderiales bacterium]|nr:hypothetical protein [Burkholderiales bacterium]